MIACSGAAVVAVVLTFVLAAFGADSDDGIGDGAQAPDSSESSSPATSESPSETPTRTESTPEVAPATGPKSWLSTSSAGSERGGSEPGVEVERFGTIVNDGRVAIEFRFANRESRAQRDAIIQSVLATVQLG